MAATLQESLKQSFIVENKAGASGNIGAAQVAKSAPDGYTVLFGIDTAFTVNPHLYAAMPFKAGDLKPVIIMASSGLLIGTHPATGIKTFGDLLGKGRQKPLNFSSGAMAARATSPRPCSPAARRSRSPTSPTRATPRP